jgi:hypothetical protein
MFREARFLAPAVFVAGALCSAIGCGRADVKDYIPADELARKCLTAGLDAWKAGKAPEAIEAAGPAVNMQDSQWKEGKKLVQYEIVGPEKGGDQNLRYRVKLSLAGETAPKEEVYVIYGKDPMWVLSEANYAKMSGM